MCKKPREDGPPMNRITGGGRLIQATVPADVLRDAGWDPEKEKAAEEEKHDKPDSTA